jgi:hypothetical protein
VAPIGLDRRGGPGCLWPGHEGWRRWDSVSRLVMTDCESNAGSNPFWPGGTGHRSRRSRRCRVGTGNGNRNAPGGCNRGCNRDPRFVPERRALRRVCAALRACQHGAVLGTESPPGESLDSDVEPRRIDGLLVVAAVLFLAGSICLALLVFVDPMVSRFGWLFGVCSAAGVASTALVARRPGAGVVARRWEVPLVGLAMGFPLIAARLTWSLPDLVLVVLVLLYLVPLLIVDVAVVIIAVATIPRNWRVGLVGVLVPIITWTAIVGVIPDGISRRARIELAAPDLIDDAEVLLASPRAADAQDPFVAHEDDGSGRVVGWPIGWGFLGRGPGLIWDPDGVLMPDGLAQTTDGYPWFIYGSSCERIVDDWLYCNMR